MKKPRAWETKSIGSFMIWLGPVSPIFDITTYLMMFYVICPIARIDRIVNRISIME